MNQNKKTEFVNYVSTHLEPLREELIASLQKIIDSELPDEVRLIRFEIFPDGFREGLPISVYLLDENSTECAYCPIQPLANVEQVYPNDMQLFDSLEDAGVDVYKTSAFVCHDWFVECWRQLDGNCPVKAEIGVHDSLDSTKLA